MSNGDGYLDTIDVFAEYGGTVVDNGTADPQPIVSGGELGIDYTPPSADIFTTPPVSTADVIRSGPASYPSAPTPSQDTVGWSGVFKNLAQAGVTLGSKAVAAAIGNTFAREPADRPSSLSSPGGAPRLPGRPFPLPSFLGGGSYTPTSGFTWIVFAAIAVVLFVIVAGRRRR